MGLSCSSQELLQGIPPNGIYQMSFVTRTLAYVAISIIEPWPNPADQPSKSMVFISSLLELYMKASICLYLFCGEVGGVVWASVWWSEGNLVLWCGVWAPVWRSEGNLGHCFLQSMRQCVLFAASYTKVADSCVLKASLVYIVQ